MTEFLQIGSLTAGDSLMANVGGCLQERLNRLMVPDEAIALESFPRCRFGAKSACLAGELE